MRNLAIMSRNGISLCVLSLVFPGKVHAVVDHTHNREIQEMVAFAEDSVDSPIISSEIDEFLRTQKPTDSEKMKKEEVLGQNEDLGLAAGSDLDLELNVEERSDMAFLSGLPHSDKTQDPEINLKTEIDPKIALNGRIDPEAVLKKRIDPTLTQSSTPLSQTEGALYVFVSCSLGKVGLTSWAHQAKALGAQLVMRGFHEGSYRKTAQLFQKIIQETGMGVSIDPELFETFQITQVPTIILTHRSRLQEEGISTPVHDRMSGNVTLRYALETFEKEGSLKRVAATYLSQGE